MAYEWGIMPQEFDNMELLEVGYYIIANVGKLKQETDVNNQKINQIIYANAKVTALMVANSMSTKPKDISFESIFPKQNENNKINNDDLLLQRYEQYKNLKSLQ